MTNERQEPLQQLPAMVARVHNTNGTGRLAVRNTTRMGTVHLYFEQGRLVHIQGTRASTEEMLIDLAGWREGLVRFDLGVLSERHSVTPEQEQFFQKTLLMLQQRGVPRGSSRPLPPLPVPEIFSQQAPVVPPSPVRPRFSPPVGGQQSAQGQHAPPSAPPRTQAPTTPPGGYRWAAGQSSPEHGISGPQARLPMSGPLPPLSVPDPLTPPQWELLVEVVRVLLEAVGQLFGRRQAQNLLRTVLAEQSEHLPVLGLVQVDRDGWLLELRAGEMIMQPRQEVAEGFVVLITDFERRCALLLGEERARQIMSLALQDFQADLAELGIAVNSA
jgi:hypothetical protein